MVEVACESAAVFGGLRRVHIDVVTGLLEAPGQLLQLPATSPAAGDRVHDHLYAQAM
jgi:hypothetical protein